MSDFWKDIKYFRPKEFVCPCCGRQKMDEGFMRWLDDVREEAGVPFVISSGWRCERHNKQIGGVAGSAHCKGIAADIVTPGAEKRYRILRALIVKGARRIGIGPSFIHVDLDKTKPQRVVWLY